MTEESGTTGPAGLHQPLIGIVDDDASVRMALANWLRSIGISSHTFASGEELLRSPVLGQLCCLILDQRMPGMTGLEVMRALELAGQRVPTIMVSAHDDKETQLRAATAGAFAFVPKPFADFTLMERVHDALDRCQEHHRRTP